MAVKEKATNGHANGAIDPVKASMDEPFRTDPFAPRTRGFYIAGFVALFVYSITPLAWLDRKSVV